MSKQRIILVNGSRLMHDLLNRILLKADHLQVVCETSCQGALLEVLEQQEAEWVVTSLPADSLIPKWTDACLKEHPKLRIMTFAEDGSWVRVEWAEKRDERITDLSLHDLIHILESDRDRFQILEETDT